MKLLKKKNGYWYVRYSAQGKTFTTSLKTKNKAEAEKLAKESKIKELEQHAKANTLTHEAVSRLSAGKKVTLKVAIEEWGKWMHQCNRRERTISCNLAWARDFGEVEAAMNTAIGNIDEGLINQWLNDSGPNRGLSTRRSMLAAIRGLFSFASTKGWITGNPAMLVDVDESKLSQRQMEGKKVLPFTVEEYQKLYYGTSGFWRFAVSLSRHCGFRLGDICTLEWSSFDTFGYVMIWTRKGKRKRVAHKLHDDTLEAFLEIDKTDDTYLFPAERADYLNQSKRSKFSVYFSRICKRLGIKGKAFHSLRHMFATELAKAGKRPEDIAIDMGHSNSETTQRYIHD